jgi:hypothetical protein
MTSAATSPITRAVMRVESSSTERDVDHLLSFQLGPGLAEVEQAANGLGAYIDELVEDRRASPRDDMVTSLVEASEDDDRLSQGELRAMIGGLLFAGYDTTRNQLGRAMVTFCHHPVQWDRLAAEPDLASRSVDEVMRLAGAVVGVPRIATEDLEIGGWAIPAGSLVFLTTTSANRDETAYDEAGTFDITGDRVPSPHLRWWPALLPGCEPGSRRDGGGPPRPARPTPRDPARRAALVARGHRHQWAEPPAAPVRTRPVTARPPHGGARRGWLRSTPTAVRSLVRASRAQGRYNQ